MDIANGIDSLAKLAGQARGIEMNSIDNCAGDPGLPDVVPIGLQFGTEPKLIDVLPFLEKWRIRPATRQGTATALTLAAFIDLTNRHKTEESVIFAKSQWTAPAITAVIDYHGRAETGHRPDNLKHRIVYSYPLSEEWKIWTSQNGKPMSQADFAGWLENRIADLASPTIEEAAALEEMFGTEIASPARLITLSRGLQVNVSAVIKDVRTLQNGSVQMQFEEEHKDGDGTPLKIPGLFMLAVSPFFSGERVRFPVRLRYRASAGKSVTWFYEIFQPELYVTARLRNDMAQITEATALPVYEGVPEQ